MAYKYYQGIFKPRNPNKYKGDVDKIIYRSGLEQRMMLKLDKDPNILKWSSEEVIIPYRNPFDKMVHRYFMDFWIKYNHKDGKVREALIEVKPSDQTKPPKVPKRKTKVYLNKCKTYAINEAKWQATRKYCDKRSMDFMIITEKVLGL